VLTADWFKLTDSSLAIDEAVPLAEVIEDFFGNPRGESPDIGAHEFLGVALPIPLLLHPSAAQEGIYLIFPRKSGYPDKRWGIIPLSEG